jgi:hypothetical protein
MHLGRAHLPAMSEKGLGLVLTKLLICFHHVVIDCLICCYLFNDLIGVFANVVQANAGSGHCANMMECGE